MLNHHNKPIVPKAVIVANRVHNPIGKCIDLDDVVTKAMMKSRVVLVGGKPSCNRRVFDGLID